MALLFGLGLIINRSVSDSPGNRIKHDFPQIMTANLSRARRSISSARDLSRWSRKYSNWFTRRIVGLNRIPDIIYQPARGKRSRAPFIEASPRRWVKLPSTQCFRAGDEVHAAAKVFQPTLQLLQRSLAHHLVALLLVADAAAGFLLQRLQQIERDIRGLESFGVGVADVIHQCAERCRARRRNGLGVQRQGDACIPASSPVAMDST